MSNPDNPDDHIWAFSSFSQSNRGYHKHLVTSKLTQLQTSCFFLHDIKLFQSRAATVTIFVSNGLKKKVAEDNSLDDGKFVNLVTIIVIIIMCCMHIKAEMAEKLK